MNKARLFIVLCTLALGCLLAIQAEAARRQPTPKEFVLQQVAAGQKADLLERFVLPLMKDQERRKLARKKGLTGYLAYLEELDQKEKENFLKKYAKHLRIEARFLEELLTRTLKVKVHRRGINIKNAILAEPLDLKSAEVPFEVELINCYFREEVNFQDSRFAQNLRLDGCHFANEAHCLKMTVEKSAYFTGAIFKGKVNFNGIIIGGSINMDFTKFESKKTTAYFNSSKIEKSAYFIKAEEAVPSVVES